MTSTKKFIFCPHDSLFSTDIASLVAAYTENQPNKLLGTFRMQGKQASNELPCLKHKALAKNFKAAFIKTTYTYGTSKKFQPMPCFIKSKPCHYCFLGNQNHTPDFMP